MKPDPLTQAGEQVRKWTRKRNRLIREAYGKESLRAIAARAGLSHTAVHKIYGRADVPD